MANSDINNIAVVYARYSSSGQREESIDGQLAAAKKYAESKGYTIIREYIDRAKTGRNDNRAAFQRMLSDTAKKTFSVIIVWKVDRFGRNREEVTFNKHRCKKNGVRIEYVAETVPEGPEGVILESVLEGMAEYYSLQLSQNVKRGLMENAKQHKAIAGMPPLGFKFTPDKHYEVDPETAPIVRLIFDKYAKGESLFSIIRYLNENGYRTTRGGKFQKSSLDRLLKNEKYIGTYIYQDIHDEDAIPAIVDKPTFYKVQKMLETNRRAPKSSWDTADYLLTDKLYCGICGDKMFGKSAYGKAGKKYNYYSCKNHLSNNGCTKQAVRRDWIESLITEEIKHIISDDNLIEFIADITWKYYLGIDSYQTEVEALQNQLEATETAIMNLIKAVEKGMPFELTKDRLAALEADKAALVSAIAEKTTEKGVLLTKDHILFFLKELQNTDISDRKYLKRLIKVFINGIFLYEDEVKIAFNYAYNGEESHTVNLSEIEQCEHFESVRTVSTIRTLRYKVRTPNSLKILPGISWISSSFVLSYRLPDQH